MTTTTNQPDPTTNEPAITTTNYYDRTDPWDRTTNHWEKTTTGNQDENCYPEEHYPNVCSFGGAGFYWAGDIWNITASGFYKDSDVNIPLDEITPEHYPYRYDNDYFWKASDCRLWHIL